MLVTGRLCAQVWRFEVVRLGVTFESDVECDGSAGLRYSWTLSDSAGRVVSLPLRDKHEQTLVLRSRVLQYDTYTATARVSQKTFDKMTNVRSAECSDPDTVVRSGPDPRQRGVQ